MVLGGTCAVCCGMHTDDGDYVTGEVAADWMLTVTVQHGVMLIVLKKILGRAYM